MNDTESLPDRLAAVDAKIIEYEATRARDTEMLEDGLAHDRDVSAIRKRIIQTDSALETARAHRRGLGRLQVVADYDALVAGIAEAERMQLEDGAAFAEIIGQLDVIVAQFSKVEAESIRLRVASDNSGVRVHRRRAALQKWLELHGEELARARRAAQPAGDDPAETQVA